MSKTLPILIFATLFLNGCAFTVDYRKPVEKSAPTIMVNASKQGGFIYFENGEDCSGVVDLPREFFQENRLVKAFPVEADKMIAISLRDLFTRFIDGSTELLSCNVVTSFEPKANNDYVVNYKTTDTGCYSEVLVKQRAAGMQFRKLEAARMRITKAGFSATSSFCE